MRLLILGSKEYPLGTSDDKLKSGGMEVYTQNFVEHAKKRFEIIIITRKFRKTKSFEIKDNVVIHRVRWIPGFYLRNPTFNFFSFLKALKLEYDVILAQGIIATIFGILLSKIKSKKIISRPAGIAHVQPQYNFLIKILLKKLEKFAYSQAYVVFLSKNEKKEFEKKLGFLPRKHAVIPTGIEIEKFSSSGVLNKRQKYITFIGRLIEVKGVEYLIKAFCNLRLTNYKLLIVGEGMQREALEKISCKNVIFAGWRRDIPEILKATEIFVLPSISEGLPIALLEALASGKACVVTNIGLPVKNYFNAIIVPPRDIEALKKAIIRLISDKKLRKKLEYNARKSARKFSWEKCVEKYERLLS